MTEPTIVMTEPTIVMTEPTIVMTEPTIVMTEPTIVMTEPTIVTAFYDIRKMENNSYKTYDFFSLANEFILTLPYPLIVFIDTNALDHYSHIINKRSSFNLQEKTCIIFESFEKTFFYQYLNTIEKLKKKYIIHNINLSKDTPYYIILNNNKFHFLERAIDINLFNSTHFLWMDFSINHVALNTEKIHDWIFNIPDKIKQLCINPYVENDDPKIFFQFIYHHSAGGLFSGNIVHMKKYISLFKKKVIEMYENEWYQIDEAIMTMIQRENPNLFEFYYGDYQGIISNYLKPFHNLELIMTGFEKTKNFGRHDLASHIENYLYGTISP